jgi:tetratricopeptide (TPR) repeat protein
MSVRWWQTADAYLLAARTERLLGNYKAAAENLENSIARRGHVDESIQMEALLLTVDTGRINAELEKQLWEKVDKQHADSALILRSLARFYVAQWEFGGALKAFDQWLKLRPDSGEALERRAQVWELMRKEEDAAEDLRLALAVAPHRTTARFALVKLLLRTSGAPGEIREHIDRLLTEDPNRPEYLVALARCQTMQGELPAGRQALDKVLAAAPRNPEALLARAELEFQAGQFASAEDWARKAVAQKPNELKASLVLADSLDRQDEPEKKQEAKTHKATFENGMADHKRLGQLLQLVNTNQHNDPDLLAEMGAILLRQGQEKAAMQCYYQVFALNPLHATAHANLAEHYEKKNMKHKAAEHRKYAKQASSK